MYLARGKQRVAGGSGLLPPPVTAITVINGDQNTQVTQRGPTDHLSAGESSAAPTVNTSPSDARVGGGIAYMRASGCVCLDLCLCVCFCVCAWLAFRALMAIFHCGHRVPSDNVTVVSLVFQRCPQTHVSHKHVDEDSEARLR